jgi:hypothetical protein
MKNIIPLFSGLLLFSLLFIACDKNDSFKTSCGTDSPLRDIAWLKETKTNFRWSQNSERITQYTYNNNTVFLIENCISNCADAMATAYDCDKNTLCQFGGIAGLNTCPDFDSLATDAVILFED